MLGVGAGQPSVPAPNPHPFGGLGWVWAGVSHGFGVVFALFCITAITANTAAKFFYTRKHFLPSPTLTQWLPCSQHSKGHRLIPPSHGTGNVPRVLFLTKLPNQPSPRLTKINKSKGQLTMFTTVGLGQRSTHQCIKALLLMNVMILRFSRWSIRTEWHPARMWMKI